MGECVIPTAKYLKKILPIYKEVDDLVVLTLQEDLQLHSKSKGAAQYCQFNLSAVVCTGEGRFTVKVEHLLDAIKRCADEGTLVIKFEQNLQYLEISYTTPRNTTTQIPILEEEGGRPIDTDRITGKEIIMSARELSECIESGSSVGTTIQLNAAEFFEIVGKADAGSIHRVIQPIVRDYYSSKDKISCEYNAELIAEILTAKSLYEDVKIKYQTDSPIIIMYKDEVSSFKGAVAPLAKLDD